jgi:TPR repeat protein
VVRDTKKAFDFALKSASGGSPLGQYCLGFIYRQGVGVMRDDAAALKWWNLAADNGFSLAKTALEKLLSDENSGLM